MTEPTRDDVREMFGFEADKAEAMSLMYDTERADVMRWRAAAFRLALALLDEGEKDTERLDWFDAGDVLTRVFAVKDALYDETARHDIRVAIDQARGA